jgi:hypothetical protein
MLLSGLGMLFAQIDRGAIVGQVTDSTGAVVPGAKIQVTNVNTNTSIALEANDQGLYTASNLPRGTYRVVVSKEGFKTSQQARRQSWVLQLLSALISSLSRAR